MNIRHSFLTALAALACAAVPASALSFGVNFGIPSQSYSCDWSQEDDQEYSNPWSQGSFSYGCMGSEGSSSGGYVMTFQSGDGSSFHCTVTWQDQSTGSRTASVPDGGSTLALLGLTLAGFVAVRRQRISGSSV